MIYWIIAIISISFIAFVTGFIKGQKNYHVTYHCPNCSDAGWNPKYKEGQLVRFFWNHNKEQKFKGIITSVYPPDMAHYYILIGKDNRDNEPITERVEEANIDKVFE